MCLIRGEAQRDPELLLESAREDRQPGRYVLTGSANLLMHRAASILSQPDFELLPPPALSSMLLQAGSRPLPRDPLRPVELAASGSGPGRILATSFNMATIITMAMVYSPARVIGA